MEAKPTILVARRSGRRLRADEDDGVDFLNAEAIEFGDGLVMVADAVAHTDETPKIAPLEQPTPAPTKEERIVDRGENQRPWLARKTVHINHFGMGHLQVTAGPLRTGHKATTLISDQSHSETEMVTMAHNVAIPLGRTHSRDLAVILEASPIERPGPHDPPATGHDPQSTHSSHESHGPLAPGQSNSSPHGATEHHRPQHESEDQHEAMNHMAEEARRRREEAERPFEEGRARARAKADEIARRIEAERAAAAAAAAAAAQELAAKEETQTTTAVDDKEDASSKSSSSATAERSPRDSGEQRPIKVLTEDQREEAMVGWRSLPGKLMAEHAETRARNIAEYQRAEQERQARKTSQGTSKTENPKAPDHVKDLKTPAIDQPPSYTESQRETESANQGTSGSDKLVTGSRSSDATGVSKDESGLGKPIVAVGSSASPSNSSLPLSQTTGALPGDQGVKTDSGADGSVKQTDDVVQKTEEKPHKDSAQADTSITAPGTQANQSHAQVDKPIPKRNGKAGRAERGNADTAVSWRKSETKPEPSEPKTGATSNSGLDKARSHTKNDRVEKVGPGSYPAKLTGANGVYKISQITEIHARLALHAAGSPIVQRKRENGTAVSKTPQVVTNKLTEGVKEKGNKRHSLLNAATPIIFPSVVESAAKKRGSMSFMVESEVVVDSTEQNAPAGSSGKPASASPEDTQPAVSSQLDNGKTPLPQPELSQEKDVSADSTTKRGWDSTSAATSETPAETSKLEDDPFHGLSQGMTPGMFMANGTGSGVVNQMGQPMWHGAIPVDSTSQSGVPMNPPYPVMMQYYQGYPHQMLYMYPPPRGAIPAHVAQFPGGVAPGHGSMPHAPKDASAGSGAALGASDMTSASGEMDTIGNAASMANLVPHPWMPPFTAAGDAPPHQPGVVGGRYIIPVPISQMAAHINQPQQLRAYPQHGHGRLVPGSASLEAGFQEGSGPHGSTDTWGNSLATSNAGNSSNNNRSHGGSSSSWSGNNRLHSNANSTSNGAPTTGNQYSYGGGYSQQHGLPNSSHRGGRGFNHNGSYREHKPRYNGGHLNSHQHQGAPGQAQGSYSSYSHSNVGANGGSHQSQHGGTSPATSSTMGAVDTQHHGHHQGMQHPHGRSMNHDGNSAGNSYSSASYSHRQPHTSGAVATTAGSTMTF
ncbi:hypothetical protein BGX31_001581 [Mortierella sp. GBA43]|nr:hypothetical protein BGX31_001581 [Mortierella sp. GBA43]